MLNRPTRRRPQGPATTPRRRCRAPRRRGRRALALDPATGLNLYGRSPLPGQRSRARLLYDVLDVASGARVQRITSSGDSPAPGRRARSRRRSRKPTRASAPICWAALENRESRRGRGGAHPFRHRRRAGAAGPRRLSIAGPHPQHRGRPERSWRRIRSGCGRVPSPRTSRPSAASAARVRRSPAGSPRAPPSRRWRCAKPTAPCARWARWTTRSRRSPRRPSRPERRSSSTGSRTARPASSLRASVACGGSGSATRGEAGEGPRRRGPGAHQRVDDPPPPRGRRSRHAHRFEVLRRPAVLGRRARAPRPRWSQPRGARPSPRACSTISPRATSSSLELDDSAVRGDHHNLGLLLRWAAALAEIRAYRCVPGRCSEDPRCLRRPRSGADWRTTHARSCRTRRRGMSRRTWVRPNRRRPFLPCSRSPCASARTGDRVSSRRRR